MKTTLLTLAALALSTSAAFAHATFEQREVTQNQTQRMVLRVPHGCGAEATLRVRVSIPDGIVAVQPMVKAGWALSTVKGPLAQPYNSHGTEITEGVREIVWEGELPSEFYDEFIFRARFTDALPADQSVFIPVVQECATGAERWIEIPAAGQSSGDLRYPAPAVKVVAPAGHGHSHGHSHGN
jgi:uncharacterized protein YcnI